MKKTKDPKKKPRKHKPPCPLSKVQRGQVMQPCSCGEKPGPSQANNPYAAGATA